MADSTNDQLYDAFGAYVRSQRHLAQLTLRQAAELASISNPYLSQIEHGLALPSIAVLGALARALRVSAETMLLRAAGIASPNPADGANQTEDSIRQDSRLDNSQKHALLAVLASFVRSSPGALQGGSSEPSALLRVVESSGTPNSGAPSSGAPSSGASGSGAPSSGAPSSGASGSGASGSGASGSGASGSVTSASTSVPQAAAGGAVSHRRKGV